MFTKVMEAGFKRVYEEDYESQKNFISIIAEQTRKVNPEVLLNAEGIFIPNNDYMLVNFGMLLMNKDFDCYSQYENCYWNNNVIFPIRDILDRVVGLVGYNPFNKMESQANKDININAYRTSSSSIFDKTKHLFGVKGVLRKAIEDGYIVLTDGVFDTLALNNAGINSAALLGSSLTEEHIAYLRMIDTVYLAVDNDQAGLRLSKTLKRKHHNFNAIRFNKYKDIDDVLKSENRDKFLKKFHDNIQSGTPTDIILKFK